MGLLDIYANTDISNPYMQQGQDHSIIKDWAKQNPYAAASIATMPLPITSAVLGAKADYDMYKNDPDSRKWYNYALSGLGLLPIIPPASAIVRSGMQGNLVDDATDALRNVRSGARNLFDVNNYGTPAYGILSNTTNVPPASAVDDAVQNYHGMFVGKRDPRYTSSSQVAADAFRAGKSDAEIFQESGIMRNPQGIFKGGDDLELSLIHI